MILHLHAAGTDYAVGSEYVIDADYAVAWSCGDGISGFCQDSELRVSEIRTAVISDRRILRRYPF